MRIALIHDAVYSREKDKSFCNKIDSNLHGSFLEHFEEITVVAREGTKKPDFVGFDMSSISVRTVPALTSVKGMLKYHKIKAEISRAVKESDAVYCRGFNGIIAQKISRRNHIPNVTYLGGCIIDSLKSVQGMGGFASSFFASFFKRSIKNSDNVIYCSPYLQKRYPTNGKAFFWTAAQIETPDDKVRSARKARIDNMNGECVIGLIGQYKNDVKGITTALSALSTLDNGYKLKILGSGDGELWKSLSDKLKVTDRVCFCAPVAGGAAVRAWLDDIDIYIQPSLTEGLPKASIEAQSRGCPLVSSGAGGLSDLTHKDFIHNPQNASQLAEKIKKVAEDKQLCMKLSEYSFDKASEYSKEKLDGIFAEACESLVKR